MSTRRRPRSSANGHDYYIVGKYTYAREKKAFGTFEPLDAYKDPFGYCMDVGNFYASKDFFDPVRNRRILWGWARGVGDGDYQTLPREILWDEELQRLSFKPVDELAKLRRATLSSCGKAALGDSVKKLWPYADGAAGSAGMQSETFVEFVLPQRSAAAFGVHWLVISDSM